MCLFFFPKCVESLPCDWLVRYLDEKKEPKKTFGHIRLEDSFLFNCKIFSSVRLPSQTRRTESSRSFAPCVRASVHVHVCQQEEDSQVGQKTDSWVPCGESRTFVFNFRDFLCGQNKATSPIFSLLFVLVLLGRHCLRKKRIDAIRSLVSNCLKLCLDLRCSFFFHLHPLTNFLPVLISSSLCVLHVNTNI